MSVKILEVILMIGADVSRYVLIQMAVIIVIAKWGSY